MNVVTPIVQAASFASADPRKRKFRVVHRDQLARQIVQTLVMVERLQLNAQLGDDRFKRACEKLLIDGRSRAVAAPCSRSSSGRNRRKCFQPVSCSSVIGSPRGIAMPQIIRPLWKKRNGRIRLRSVTPSNNVPNRMGQTPFTSPRLSVVPIFSSAPPRLIKRTGMRLSGTSIRLVPNRRCSEIGFDTMRPF